MIEADPSDPSSLVSNQQTGFIRFYRVSCGLTDLPGVFKMKHLSHVMPCALYSCFRHAADTAPLEGLPILRCAIYDPLEGLQISKMRLAEMGV